MHASSAYVVSAGLCSDPDLQHGEGSWSGSLDDRVLPRRQC